MIDGAHGFEAESRRQWAVKFLPKRRETALGTLGGVGAIHAAMVAPLETLRCSLAFSRSAAAVPANMAAMGNLMATVHELAPGQKRQHFSFPSALVNDEVERQRNGKRS